LLTLWLLCPQAAIVTPEEAEEQSQRNGKRATVALTFSHRHHRHRQKKRFSA
jgi:hypothetical protein